MKQEARMLKLDAIKFYGTKAGVARAAGVDPSAVSQWGDLVPEKNAYRLQMDSAGELVYDPAMYDKQAIAKRAGNLTDENQASR